MPSPVYQRRKGPVAAAALTALERGYEERDIRLAYLQIDHRWAAVRGDARFVALARKLGLDPRPPQAPCTF